VDTKKELAKLAGVSHDTIHKARTVRDKDPEAYAELIAGRRRIEAFRRLGRSSIPIHRVPLDAIIRGEHAENIIRKNLTMTELYAIGRALEAREKKAAKERAEAGRKAGGKVAGRGRSKKDGANFAQSNHDANKTSRRVGKAVGLSGKTTA